MDLMPRGMLRAILRDGGTPPATPLPATARRAGSFASLPYDSFAKRFSVLSTRTSRVAFTTGSCASNVSRKGASCQDPRSVDCLLSLVVMFTPVSYTLFPAETDLALQELARMTARPQQRNHHSSTVTLALVLNRRLADHVRVAEAFVVGHRIGARKRQSRS